MAQRSGHRPLLTPAQAAYLAQHLFGVSALSGPIPESCVELPSYDDRNFKLAGFLQPVRTSPRPDEEGLKGLQQQQQVGTHLRGASAEQQTDDLGSGAAGGPGSGRKGRAFEGGAGEQQVEIVIKVHNTQDSDQAAQLQSMDDAMMRLQAAGISTNTPFRPAGRSGGTRPPPHERPVPEPCGSQQPFDLAGQQPKVHVRVAEDLELNTARVPYRVAVQSEAALRGNEDAASGPLSCWALLPCTCHPAGRTSIPEPMPSAGATAADSSCIGQALEGAELGREHRQQPGSGPDSEGRPELRWHIVRCLTFVPGQMLSSVACLTPRLFVSLGELMGRVSASLAGWQPPALLARCSHDWYPENGAAVLRRLVPDVEAFDKDKKALLLRVAAELEAAAPLLAADAGASAEHRQGQTPGAGAPPGALPRQVCHADANDDNCLVNDDGSEVVGLIDFGDMAFMPRVCEISITITYALLLALNRPVVPPPLPLSIGGLREVAAGHCGQAGAEAASGGDQAEAAEESDRAILARLLAVAGLVLAGFQQTVPLLPEELRVLPLLVRGRLAQSLALGATSAVADPGNAAYLLATQRPGWQVLRLLTPGVVLTEELLLGALLEAGAVDLGPV